MKRRSAISQREARRLRARVTELEGVLERQRNAYAREWPHGVHIGSVHSPSDALRAAVVTARKLGHGVVVTMPEPSRLDFIAIPTRRPDPEPMMKTAYPNHSAATSGFSVPSDGYVAPERPARPVAVLDRGIGFLYDTETTGLPDYHAPSGGPQQPHIAQFAGALVDLETRVVLERFSAIGRPDGWQIPAEVAAIHGITTERALAEGIPEADIVERLLDMQARATLRVAHNVSFDDRIVRIALKRFRDDATADHFRDGHAVYCTCKATTNLCRLPFANGRRGRGGAFKFPKLEEAYRHFFGREMTGAHTADGDLDALIAVFFAIQDDAAARAAVLG